MSPTDTTQYGLAAILIVLVLGLAVAMILVSALLSRLLRVQKPSAVKGQPYECGMTPIGGARVRFSVKFYLVAMLFILFDVEAIFLYLWAPAHRMLGWVGVAEIGVFIALLGAGYVYLWKRGAFQWDN